MPRKTLKDRRQKNPTQTKRNRIRENINILIGIENPDMLLVRLLSILKDTVKIPTVGEVYTFSYSPKTRNIQYDAHPLVAVTEVYPWGFRGINFHWKETRQYTWSEINGSLHLIYKEELADVRNLPFGKIKLNE